MSTHYPRGVMHGCHQGGQNLILDLGSEPEVPRVPDSGKCEEPAWEPDD